MVTQQEVPSTPPAITPQQQVADNFVTQFLELMKLLPAPAGEPTNARFVRSHLNVSDDFLRAAIDAVEKIPGVGQVSGYDATAAREKMQTLDAFGPAIKQVAAALNTALYALRTIRASLVDTALRTYYITKRLARDAQSQVGPVEAGIHVEAMKKTIRRGRKKKTTTSTPSPGTPQPSEKKPEAPQPSEKKPETPQPSEKKEVPPAQ